MGTPRTHRRKALWIGPLLVALLVTGCAGIKPYEPGDYRQEGPQRGLFTGSEGEFVIFTLGMCNPQFRRIVNNSWLVEEISNNLMLGL